MKRYLLIIMAAFANVLSFAQSYQPMLKDGRVWKTIKPSIFQGYEPDLYFTYTVCGDTIIGEKTCKKVHVICESEIPPLHSIPKEFTSTLYEEGGKVYNWGDVEYKPFLLLDFNLHKGENIALTEDKISEEDSIEVHGKKYRRLILNTGFTNQKACWVEGIGASQSWWASETELPTGNYYYELMLGCYDNGELIFSQEDFSKEPFYTGIHTISAGQCRTSGMYDISGQRINAPHKGEVYIKDGKKRVEK